MNARQHVDHVAEAERLVANASRHITEDPRDMRIAEVSAMTAQVHATLAHLPEQMVQAQEQVAELRERLDEYQRDLTVTQRVVGGSIAETLIDGHDAAQQFAWGLAASLRTRGVPVEAAIEGRMEALGHTYDPDMPPPVHIIGDGEAPKPTGDGMEAAAYRKLAESYRELLIGHITAELQTDKDERWAAANALAERLNEADLGVDDAVDYRLDHHTDMGLTARKKPSERWPGLHECPF